MIDFIAGGFELFGSYSIGNRRRFGFLVNMAGDLLWVYIGVTTRLYGLVTIAALALGFNVRNFIKWRKSS